MPTRGPRQLLASVIGALLLVAGPFVNPAGAAPGDLDPTFDGDGILSGIEGLDGVASVLAIGIEVPTDDQLLAHALAT